MLFAHAQLGINPPAHLTAVAAVALVDPGPPVQIWRRAEPDIAGQHHAGEASAAIAQRLAQLTRQRRILECQFRIATLAICKNQAMSANELRQIVKIPIQLFTSKILTLTLLTDDSRQVSIARPIELPGK